MIAGARGADREAASSASIELECDSAARQHPVQHLRLPPLQERQVATRAPPQSLRQ